MSARPYTLSIAGFDPSSGAGVSADIKTMEAIGVHGLGVTTAITYQNDTEFKGVDWLAIEQITKQCQTLFDRYPISVCKIGLIESLETLKQLLLILRRFKSEIFIIWDPILSASAGFEFHNIFSKELLYDVILQVDLVTPNKAEWDIFKAILSKNEFKTLTSILLKGSHNYAEANDILFHNDSTLLLQSERLDKKYNKHGTGCSLSAAIAAGLAKSEPIELACKNAKRFVKQWMQSTEHRLGVHSG